MVRGTASRWIASWRPASCTVVALLLSCARESPVIGQPDWTVRDSAGVTIVANHTDGSARGCVTIAPEPERTVPAGPAAPPLFGVHGGALLDGGRIAILNAGDRQVLLFSADGRFERAVGRQGSGPGEFQNPRWLGRGDGDTLFVWDGRLMRLTILDGSGDLVSVHQVRVGDELGMPIAIQGRFDDGSFLYTPGSLAFFDGTPGIVRLPETYGRYETATGRAEPLIERAGMESVSNPGGPIYVLPFGKQDIVIALGDGLVAGDNGTSRLHFYDLEGTLRRTVDWESAPVPVTSRDREEYWRRFREVFPRQVEVADRADRTEADERPRFSALTGDRAGWLWMRTYTASWEPRGHWLLFDEEGVLRCAVDPPSGRFGLLDATATHVLGVERDEDGVETVVLHALVRAR